MPAALTQMRGPFFARPFSLPYVLTHPLVADRLIGAAQRATLTHAGR